MTLTSHKATDTSAEKDYWPAIQSMITADIGSMPELVLRYAVIFLGALSMTWATQSPVIALWLTGFLVANGYYSWWLSRLSPPVHKRTYTCLVALLMISVTFYTSCAVYLFMLDTTAMRTIALAALAAQSLFNLSRHRHSTLTAFYDTFLVVLAALFFGLSGMFAEDMSLPEKLIICVCSFGVCSYYVIAQYRNILLNQKLMQAQVEAIQTQKMRAIGQLTTGISHDFNNLLTAISGNMELAKIADDPIERDERLDDAMAAADRAAKLTSQLLSFSRKAHLQATQIKLEHFWQYSNNLYRRVVPATVDVATHCDPDLEYLHCDRNQLENAILNLVLNARDAMEGKGHLTLISRPCTKGELEDLGLGEAKTSAFGAIEVCDTGPGIPADQLEAVTEPFYTTKEVGSGSGLGLSMAKGFAEQSGGRLSIRCDDFGTTVTMVLPTGQADKMDVGSEA